MDCDRILDEVLKKLRGRREALDTAIGALEQMGKPKARRGRKSMAPAERLQVSERMKKYWASRRATGGGTERA